MTPLRAVPQPPGAMRVRAIAEAVLRLEEPGAKLTYRHVDDLVASWETRAKSLGMDVRAYAKGAYEAARDMRELEEDEHLERLARGEAVRHPEEQPPELDTPIPFHEEDPCEL